MIEIAHCRKIRGIVHWHQDNILVRSQGRQIEVSEDSGEHFTAWCRLPERRRSCLLSLHRLGRRLGRRNVKHLEKLGEQNWICIDRDAVWKLGSESKTPLHQSVLHGSRPLRIVARTGRVLYGEYRGNPDRDPINLWESSDEGLSWKSVYQFKSIRHVHGVFEDPEDRSIWVTSGDLDDESAIWRLDPDLGHATRICGGSQQFRVIDLVFHGDYIYFGTDAPDHGNAIYRMSRTGEEIERLQSIAGPVFHGRAFQGGMVFTTACEPSQMNKYAKTQVWFSQSGRDWTNLVEFKKDRWSMKFLQYGQVMMASGEGNSLGFWITPFATELDQQSVFIPFDSASVCVTAATTR